jgi:prevent-host-death family protein
VTRVVLNQDIRPISELREKATAFVQQVRETQRPMVITQHGRSAAVLMDVTQYEQLLERLELFEAIHRGEHQIAEGKYASSKVSRDRMLERLNR